MSQVCLNLPSVEITGVLHHPGLLMSIFNIIILEDNNHIIYYKSMIPRFGGFMYLLPLPGGSPCILTVLKMTEAMNLFF
jgi:hypothetical protein